MKLLYEHNILLLSLHWYKISKWDCRSKASSVIVEKLDGETLLLSFEKEEIEFRYVDILKYRLIMYGVYIEEIWTEFVYKEPDNNIRDLPGQETNLRYYVGTY